MAVLIILVSIFTESLAAQWLTFLAALLEFWVRSRGSAWLTQHSIPLEVPTKRATSSLGNKTLEVLRQTHRAYAHDGRGARSRKQILGHCCPCSFPDCSAKEDFCCCCCCCCFVTFFFIFCVQFESYVIF